ncbi:MAG TPA: tetratricopeptide repeat protein [Vicinamibacterales bacterium]|nr:tetratricopeptide repeat protein [Vicinamibacterales bacterium]
MGRTRGSGTAGRSLCAGLVCVAALAAACAPRLVPAPVVTAPAHPDYLYPDVPSAFVRPQLRLRLERGWQFLQAGDPTGARREFAAALKLEPGFYPAEAGLGYTLLAGGDAAGAEDQFERALARDARYVPGLVGRGDALLALGRVEEAATAYQAALAENADLPEVRRRLEAVSFRAQQASLQAAREAAAAGRSDEAVRAYQRALAASPDSAFLYRELAAVERKRGDRAQALDHLRRATGLEPGDRQSWIQIGELLEEAKDYPAALSAYEQAWSIEPGEELRARLDRLRRTVTLAGLPEEYRRIAQEPALTRGELAALIGVRLADLVEANQRRPALVLTDARGHWASGWMLGVARAGIMDPYPNHTFDPETPVRRLDLAQAVSRVLDLAAARRPALAQQWQGMRPAISDLPPGHLGYPPASMAVASGVMRLQAGSFNPTRPVGGAEALEVLDRLEVLVR